MEFNIYNVSNLKKYENNSLLFVNELRQDDLAIINKLSECVIITKETKLNINNENSLVLFVENPRKEFAKILSYILSMENRDLNYIKHINGYCMGENVKVGLNTLIEPFCFIDSNVVIGNNCYIKSGVKINKYSIIGDNCIIGENAVIGGPGFGIERDSNSAQYENYRIPHLGGVIIKDNVEVGALVSIASGTIDPTVINEYVKIDDCVFIAHNCNIGKGTFIIANAEVSGSVTIGEGAWIGPNVSIIQKVKIGKKATVGIGAVVTKDIEENMIVAGNPADDIETIKGLRKFQKETMLK
jgi:UDP-3-O-[3-hydroxymyristoyl] glucosamine N-acyltransferase